jgi:two-component system chemotaxis sensor kinase CheA
VSFPSDEQASELRDLFFESAQEILQGMNEAGLALEERPGDVEQLRSVRRAVHTLKGDSAACGYRELSELAHDLEDVLTPELARQNAGLIAEVILTAADTFHEMLAAYRNNIEPPAGGALKDYISRLLNKPAAQGQKESVAARFEWSEYERLMIVEALRRGENVYNISIQLDPESLLPAAAFELSRKSLEAGGRILALRPEIATEGCQSIQAALATTKTADWIRKRCHVPSVVSAISVERAPVLQSQPRDLLEILIESEAKAISGNLVATAESVLAPTATAAHAPAHEDDEEAREHSSAAGMAHAASENMLRVDAHRIDAVMNLVGEMIIGKSMLQRAMSEFERRHSKDPIRGKLADALGFQSRVLNELQKSVMKIRMVPVEQLFRRFPRIIRDVARLRNKEIALEIAGQTTDLDKSILDALGDPLAHLVRNAADHGIETAAERQASGKSPRGTIRLNAYHDGDQVVIEVSDDGHGLDRAKILRRAIERGIVTAETAAQLNELESLQLIFAPGLSTADEVTEISGRGVGLDVVKSSLEALKGSIELNSVPGRGTTFRLLVPLTLASIRALMFYVQGRLYAVPLASVAEITRITEQGIHRVDDHEVFQLREQVLTLVRLDRLEKQQRQSPADRARRIFVIVIGTGGRKFGLAVDSLMGEEELVIKALEDQLVTSPIISGASILGDGTVVLILNVPAVVAHLSRIPAVGAIA